MPFDQIAELEESIGPKRAYALALKEKLARLEKRKLEDEKGRQAEPGGFIRFIRYYWPAVEPARPLIEGWPLDAICDHLEAVTYGDIRRLLINVCPGFMKSMCANVFWPAWEWGPMGLASYRFIAASYSQGLTLRDNIRFRNIIMSPEYQAMYSGVFSASKDQFNLIKVANSKTGWKLATSVGGIGTGERGDRFVIDDGNSVKEAESEAVLASTNQWFLEVVPTRLNDAATGAIINIQQRTSEDDISGTILARELDYDHLVIRMEYDSGYDNVPTSIGWVDPREEDGELAWPERFPRDVVDELKDTMGPYAVAGQFQQSPEPRGGGILRREYWQPWEEKDYPECDFVLASLDPAFTSKEENDPSGFTIWGTFLTKTGFRAAILLHAFRKRLEIRGPDIPRYPGETDKEYRFRCQDQWGLVETVHDACRRFKADHLIIENKASGLSVIQTMARLFVGARYTIQAFDPKNLDKTARMIRVQPEFSGGQIYAPFEDGSPKAWAGMVIDECGGSSRRRYFDLTDSTTQAIYWLRTQGFLERREEQFLRKEDAMRDYKQRPPLYSI
jgi:hypothetical protein